MEDPAEPPVGVAAAGLELADFVVRVERREGLGPAMPESEAEGERGLLAGEERDQAARGERRSDPSEERVGVLEVEQDPVAKDDVEGTGDEGGEVLAAPENQADPGGDLGRFVDQAAGGLLEQGHRGVHDGDVVALMGQGDGLVAGPTAHVEDPRRGRREVPGQLVLEEVDSEPARQAGVGSGQVRGGRTGVEGRWHGREDRGRMGATSRRSRSTPRAGWRTDEEILVDRALRAASRGADP
jgi:hypothetical protein